MKKTKGVKYKKVRKKSIKEYLHSIVLLDMLSTKGHASWSLTCSQDCGLRVGTPLGDLDPHLVISNSTRNETSSPVPQPSAEL